MNIKAEIKQREFRLTQMEVNTKASQKDLTSTRTKYNLAKKKLFSQMKLFSSLTIEEIDANDEKVEDKQNQMDVQLKRIKEMYEKYVNLGQTFNTKQEAFEKHSEEYEKVQLEMAELADKMEEEEEEVQEPVNKFKLAKKKKN